MHLALLSAPMQSEKKVMPPHRIELWTFRYQNKIEIKY
jgi:hypothetical protein